MSLLNDLRRLTSRHSADERVKESDFGKHVEVNANRDQLYGKECVLQDEKRDCSGMNDRTGTGGTAVYI